MAGKGTTATASAGIGEDFDDVVLPHLDAAYRLARWLMRNEDDAEDIVQEASLRALRYFRTFSGGNGRAWFLRIVRNTCWSWHDQSVKVASDLFDEEQHRGAPLTPDPETLLLHEDNLLLIDRTMSDLPDRPRELLVLRELEGLSYQELADVLEIPIGSVMSGLSRARLAFRKALDVRRKQLETPGSARARGRGPDAPGLQERGRRATPRVLEAVGAAAAGPASRARRGDE